MNRIVLSYHIFGNKPSEYRFSRTYDQLWHDARKKIYDEITIDDGRKCSIHACEILRELNRRAKLFISPSLVGRGGYCTWDELRTLSEFHDIENHSMWHKDHTKESADWQYESIVTAQRILEEEIGRAPRYFVAPFNQYDGDTDSIIEELGLMSLKDRINMLNFSK